MPTNISDIPEFTANVVVPLDGELITGADRALTAQSLANRTRYLQVNGSASKPATFRSVPLSGFKQNEFVVPQQYIMASSGIGAMVGVWVQLDVAGAAPLLMDLAVPPGVTLTQLLVTLDGDAGAGSGHSALPATMPTLSLFEINPSTGVPFTSFSATDISPNVAAYDGLHQIALNFSRFVTEDRRYLVKFTGETGANSQAGLTMTGLQITWSVP